MNLFTPIGVELRDGKIDFTKNEARAETISANDKTNFGTMASGLRDKATEECLKTTPQKAFCFRARAISSYSKVSLLIYMIGQDLPGSDNYYLDLKIKDSDGKDFTSTGAVFEQKAVKEDQNVTASFTGADKSVDYDGYLYYINSIPDFNKDKQYNFTITIEKKHELAGIATYPIIIASGLTAAFFTAGVGGALVTAGTYAVLSETSKGSGTVVIENVKISGDSKQVFSGTADGDTSGDTKGTMPACNMNPFDKGILNNGAGTPMGCVAQGIYYVLFVPTSYIFALAGTLFDKAFAYSVDDNNYRSDFVVQGWKVVRDFCNMFFIFILLYVAFTTILNTHGAKTKETIINVIIIGLLINFSLFATQVIIDASNVLARVFYNSDTIKITEDGANGVAGATGTISGDGVLPISAALVNKVNPQNIIINAGKVNIQEDTRKKGVASIDAGTSEEEQKTSLDTGTFILVTLLATAVNIVGLIVFLSVALIFITRVIGLWLAMIFVPFTFLSYTIPAMQDFEMVGWKKWWPETLKMAFLAPVFIFFMYLIIKFLNTGLGLLKTDEQAFGLSFIVGIILPFAFIMIFLMKAKDIAKDLSGKIGQQITDSLSKVGGFALGAATGGAAMLGRATLGRAGNAIADSDKLKAAEAKGGIGGFMASKLRNVGTAAGKGSMDIRGIKIAGKGIGDVGIVSNVGKPKEGGFTKIKEDQKIKAEKRAKELELGENSPEKKKLREEEASLKSLENKNSKELEESDREIARTKAIRDDANAAKQANPDDDVLKDAAKKAQNEYQKALSDKKAITNGGLQKDGTYNTHNGKIGEDVVENANKDAETASAKLTGTQLNAKVSEQTATEEFNAVKEKHDEVTASIAELEKSEQEATEKFNAVSEKFKSGTASTVELDRAKKEVSDIQGKRSEMTTSLPDIKSAQEKLDAVKNKNAEDIKRDEEELKLAKDEADRVNKEALGGTGKSINRLKNKFIPDANHHIHEKNNKIKELSAQNLEKTSTKIFNLITTGGQYSTRSADIAAHNIRMGIKTESSGGGHGGGGGGGDSHAAHPAPKEKVEVKPTTTDKHEGGGGHDAKH